MSFLEKKERPKLLFPTPAQVLGEALAEHMARQNFDRAEARDMIARGACVKQVDRIGSTALFYACRWGERELALLLLEKGADPDAQNDNGVTPLISAAYDGDLELVQALLKKNADPHIANFAGKMPVDLSRARKHDSVTEVLVHEVQLRKDFSEWVGRVRAPTTVAAPRLNFRGAKP